MPSQDDAARRFYYATHCPYAALTWLAECNHDALWKREFAIEGDYYKRYVEAKNAYELYRVAHDVRGLKTMHIGPVCTGAVSLLRKGLSVPHRRELIFDLDLTDYDHLELTTRDASGAEVVDMEACDRAWGFAAIGLFLLRYLLREHFGYEHFLIVYSGRRGAHLWVLDERAMTLSDEGRAAVASFVNLELTKNKKRAHSGMLTHANIYNLFEVVEDAFQDLVVDRGYFDDAAHVEDFVDRLELSHESLRSLADDAMAKGDSSGVWKYLCDKIDHAAKATKQKWMRDRLKEVMVAYVWPRIDFNVTKAVNHLIKCPYVAHPKTGRIAIPVDSHDYWRFDPSQAPTIHDLGPHWKTIIDIERHVVRDPPTLPTWRPRTAEGKRRVLRTKRPTPVHKEPKPTDVGMVASDDEDEDDAGLRRSSTTTTTTTTIPDLEDLVPAPVAPLPREPPPLLPGKIVAATLKRQRFLPKPSPLGPCAMQS